jgi:hypothetical protein
MRTLIRSIVIIAITSLLTVTAVSAESALTNKDVVSLSQLGIGDTAVIAKIRQASAVDFKLDVPDLAALKKAGVAGTVIAAMLERAMPMAAPQGTASTVREPDYIGNFCWRNPSTLELTPLERQTGSAGVDVKAMGFGGAETYMRVGGDRSPVRFKEGDATDFVVLVSSQSIDPQGIAQLFALDSVGGDRRLPVARAISMGLAGRSVMTENQIAVRTVRYGRSSFLVSPVEPLGPGEYAFAGPITGVGFCFAVDANPGAGVSRFERLIPLKQGEVIPLGITDRGMTVHSIEVIRWPTPNEAKPDAKGEIVVRFASTNKAGRDYKCTYDVVLLDDSGSEIGAGKRTVGIEDGDEDTTRVGIKLRLADLGKAAKLRVRAVPAPDL